MQTLTLNDRQRHAAVLTFGQTDCVPFTPGHGRRSTRAAWYRQGLPQHITDYQQYLRQLLGLPEFVHQPAANLGMSMRMIPEFEEKVIEHHPAPAGSTGPGSLIVQDWKGNICEISDEYSVHDLRDAVDFVTRNWLKCPVETHGDWLDMKKRYDAYDSRRVPADIAERCRLLKQRDYWSAVSLHGPFWQLREWMGFENLCMAILDDPAFVHEMIVFWDDFITRYLERVFAHDVPDMVIINEDMAYKEKPMIGPEQCRRFLLPTWRRWADQCHKAGVKIVEVDSDGHVGMLIPVWIEAGIDSNSPMEVAAGNDLPAYRKLYGKDMAYRGGVDKREMAKGGKFIEQEIARLRPVIDAGGYIPGCDHGVPSDVSWPDFVHYAKLLAQATGLL